MTMQDRERDRRSLQDLAKMALTPPPPSVSVPAGPAGPNSASGVQRAADAKDDSGIVDLAAAAASDPQGAERAQSTALASAGLFDDEPQSVRPPMSGAVAQPVPTIPPMPASMPPSAHPTTLLAPVATPMPVPVSAAPASSAALPTVVPQNKKGGKLVAVVFGLVAISAVAAGTFVFLKGRQAAHEGTVAMNDKPTTTTATPVAKADPAPTETAAPAPSEPGTGLDTLPAASPADAKIAGKPRATGRPAAAAPAAAKPAAEAPKEDPKVAQKDLATGPGAAAGSLGDAIAKEVGPKDPTPAAGPAGQSGPAAGSVPQKPSQGAITGALGSVLPEARRCLGPDDPISRASVVFGSNGTVQSVNVSGGAAGKPAEACIKGALMKAKVAPFAEAQYSAPVTIRH